MELPLSLVNDLNCVPRDRPVTLLMRHSARYPILYPADPYLAQLTPEGFALAEELGRRLGRWYGGGRLLSAPVDRCIDTAQSIARGAGWAGQVGTDERLSHPFIEPAFESFARGEVNGALPWQAKAVLALLLAHAGSGPLLDVMVTHDTILVTVAGCLLKAPVLKEFWPEYLEGLFVWQAEGQVCVRWRGAEWRFHPAVYLNAAAG